MNFKSKKAIYILLIFFTILTIDRYFWMPERVKKLWVNEKGRNLGDPIAFKQDFTLDGSLIIFNNNKSKEDYPFVYKNRQSKFYLAGCYFGNLYIYDTVKNEIIIYSDY